MPDNNPDLTPETPGTNTKTSAGAKGINPSAPNAGTSAWGETTDERRVDTRNNASGPDAEGAGDVRRTSYPQNEAAHNPAAHPGLDAKSKIPNMDTRRQALQDNPNNRAGKTFSCADVGRENCNWSVTATHEDDIVDEVRRHAREAHNQEDFTDEELRHVRDAIRDRAA